ncbi:pumilio-repeat, RNA-binding protein [Strigomonas culicis]|uniref:Pumilio-repeat, RNA-binding protein n=1 Tax=Strigomonas culicis TaxID=28005 RepID=S9VNL5_9TRYP|nr:pumilio-repeat, RNA-binding protein [Strigomonas culicis]|eukprot:EPY24880.1 pumilio-repeat, RNA-binding protein [Strigomonas culicis]
MDLCALLQQYAEAGDDEAAAPAQPEQQAAATASRKRPRAESSKRDGETLDRLVDAFLLTQNTPVGEGADGEEEEEDEEPVTVLEEMVQCDVGRRVTVALLAALAATEHAKRGAVAKALLELFEENEHLPEHYVACRILSALTRHGTDDVQVGVLDLMRQRGTTWEGVRKMLCDRHTSVTVEHLLQRVPAATAEWLCEVLGLSAAAPKKKKASAKKAAEEEPTAADITHLVEDPVAGQVMQRLAQTHKANAALLQTLDLDALLETKRGTALLAQLVSFPADQPPAAKEAAAAVERLYQALGPRLKELCVDKSANFVVSRLLQLLPHTGAKSSASALEAFVDKLGGAEELRTLTQSSIGVHVANTLIDVAIATDAAEEVAALLMPARHVKEMLTHPQEQLVIRHLMPLVAKKQSKAGQLLLHTINDDTSLAYDAMGNLVFQDYLKALGPAGASHAARKMMKEDNLLHMCQHASAAHVVHALLDLVDSPTQTALCNALKQYVVQLATHINGRFVVEKLVRVSREVRDELVKQFTFLARSRGTQHLLCTLFACLDARGKQNVVDRVLVPQLSALAIDQCASITLQKLAQADPVAREAMHKMIRENSRLRSDLLQNFYGKFLVRICETN